MSLRIKLAAVAVAALAGYGLWLAVLRDLPLFQVQSVAINGLSGGAAPEIETTLELTAREMTTTNFSLARLRAAVAGYHSVASLSAHTEFPHGVRIDVVERRALARLDYNGQLIAVSGNGAVLAGIRPARSLPLLHSDVAPVGDRIADPVTLEELALLAAAPEPLLGHVYQVRVSGEGLTVRLRHGPLIYFGDAALPHAKWDSAAVVLASSSSRGARYIDVSLPARPAAAVGDPATAVGASGSQGSASVATLVGAGSPTTSSSTSG